MLPSVTVLCMYVHFGVRNELKMIPSFLRCFPNVEDLHIWVKPLALTLLLALICTIMYYHHIANC
jgi:hypothetical protein